MIGNTIATNEILEMRLKRVDTKTNVQAVENFSGGRC